MQRTTHMAGTALFVQFLGDLESIGVGLADRVVYVVDISDAFEERVHQILARQHALLLQSLKLLNRGIFYAWKEMRDMRRTMKLNHT